MRKHRLLLIYVVTAVVAGVSAHFTLKRVNVTALESGRPFGVGRLKGANITVHLGNVAVPNRLISVPGKSGEFRLDPRLRFWDAYLVTAPVPEVVSTDKGVRLRIPWTLLPGSVVSTVRQLEPVPIVKTKKRVVFGVEEPAPV